MKISQIECVRLTAPLHTPFVTALRSTDRLETLVVEVRTADGLSGFGEAPQVWRVTGESLAGAEACVRGPLSDVVLNRSTADLHDVLTDVTNSVVGNFGAKAAVDVALHDLAARSLGVSLPRFLGGSRHVVATDVTVPMEYGDELSASTAERVAEGFRALKIKVGTHVRQDIGRVKAIRDDVGPEVSLRIDANQGWAVGEAVTAIRALEDAGVNIEFVEQPVPAEDLDGLAAVTSAVSTPVMADEACYGLRDLVRIISTRAADMVNVKLAKCGGLRVGRTLLELAHEHGLGTIVGSMMEGPIGVGAAASLVAAYGTSAISDLDAAWWTKRSPVIGGLTYGGGNVHLPAAPGLGIQGLR